MSGSKTARKPAAKAAARTAARAKSAPHAQSAAKALEEFAAAMKAFQKRDYPRARSHFRAVLDADPADQTLADRARGFLAICERQAHPESPSPRDAEERCTRGVLLLNEGDVEGALEHFVEATRDGGGGQAWYLAACAMARSGRHEEALSALRRAIGLDPSNRSRAANDRDFLPLCDLPGFGEIMSGGAGSVE